MARKRRQFICQQCGSVHSGWMGKCPDCGAWDALLEQPMIEPDPHIPAALAAGSIGAYGSLAGEGGGTADSSAPMAGGAPLAGSIVGAATPVAISQIIDTEVPRLASGLVEFDRILGGGLVPGSAVLIGGDPGIGKSTLLLQAADRLAGNGDGLSILYVTSEESVRQTQLRARRLGVRAAGLSVMAATNLDLIANQIVKSRPAAVVIDSIQMVYKPSLPAAPGTVSQLRQCGLELVYLAKATGSAVLFVGHLTKAGTIAGPRLLEHIVDTVLYFEGDRHQTYRMIRAVKNRYGSTNEIGLFRMTDSGLQEVSNPSEMFLLGGTERTPGSLITAAVEGSRVILVEVQALTTTAGFGAPKRKVSGADANRVAMILAVLEKRAGLHLADQDVFVNVVGGVRLVEPSADLPIALAIAGAFANRAAPARSIAVGEVGLGGELRGVGQFEARLAEADKLGFAHAILPAGAGVKRTRLTVHACKRLDQAIECLS